VVGAFGQSTIFVCLLAGLAVVTPFFFLHVAHIHLTVLTMSSGGVDRLRWPRETYYEWFGQGATIFGVLFVWTGLALIPVAALMAFGSPSWGVATWLLTLWLMAPVSLCSVMTAPSPLLFLYPPLIGRFLMHARGLAFVYLVTGSVFFFVLLGFWLMFIVHNVLGVFLVSFSLPPALMLHGRAWGRLAWLALNYDRPAPKKKKRKKKAVATAETLDVNLEVTGEDGADYAVKPALAAASSQLPTMTEYYEKQREYERRLRERAGDPNPDPLEAPRVPTFGLAFDPKQIFGFLFDTESLGVWLALGIGCLVEMTLLFFLFG
jgi:hypothetical protein